MVNDMETIGKRIRKIRGIRGMSRKEVASLVGICPATLVLLESGKRCPSLLSAVTLADVLGITLDDFFSDRVSVEI